jgi:hypothetical protein
MAAAAAGSYGNTSSSNDGSSSSNSALYDVEFPAVGSLGLQLVPISIGVLGSRSELLCKIVACVVAASVNNHKVGTGDIVVSVNGVPLVADCTFSSVPAQEHLLSLVSVLANATPPRVLRFCRSSRSSIDTSKTSVTMPLREVESTFPGYKFTQSPSQLKAWQQQQQQPTVVPMSVPIFPRAAQN